MRSQLFTERVAPFGNQRIKACLQLPVAYRRKPRPSSRPDARASPVRPFLLDHITKQTTSPLSALKSTFKGYLLFQEEAFLKPCRMMCSCKNLLNYRSRSRYDIARISFPCATSTQSKLSLLIFTFVFPRAPLLSRTSLSQYICCKRSCAFPDSNLTSTRLVSITQTKKSKISVYRSGYLISDDLKNSGKDQSINRICLVKWNLQKFFAFL